MKNLVERFIKYVKINTQSDEKSKTCPSTKNQFDLAKMLAKELKDDESYKDLLDRFDGNDIG